MRISLAGAEPSVTPPATAVVEALYDCARATVLEPDATALARALGAALARTFRADDVFVAAIIDSEVASCASRCARSKATAACCAIVSSTRRSGAPKRPAPRRFATIMIATGCP